MKSIRKIPVRTIDGNVDRNSKEFKRMKDRADARLYNAVRIATAVISIGIMTTFAVAATVDKKPEKASAETVLCEDRMEAKDGKMANDIPKCVKKSE